MTRSLTRNVALASTLLAWAAAARAADGPSEFFNPRCVTPAGQAGPCSESPSTTFVISGDEVRHAGASSIPEILRRVPGLDVRTITATDGETGLRGFAYEITDRVLVFVDGRAVYIDFFGGTAWEMLPVSVLDIEQIEVVLGPSASVYGNKAMLGTINIITRSANDYPYAEARLDAGTPGDGRIAARYGAISGPWQFRATGLGRRLASFDAGAPAGAGGGTVSATYRPSTETQASVEVGGMRGSIDMIPTNAVVDRFDGKLVSHVRAQGRKGLGGPGSPYGDLNLDLVWNAGEVRSAAFPVPTTTQPGGLAVTYHTEYARLHHELRTTIGGVPFHGRWGGEVRLNTFDSNITEAERPMWNVAAFASEEALLGRWRLTAGVRVDNSTLTRTSFSPRLSVVWSPAEGHQLRAAFNTGYNDPNLVEYFADFAVASPASPYPGVRQRSNLQLEAEHMAYGEIGWTGILTPWLRAIANAFAYRFYDWISLDPDSRTVVLDSLGNPYLSYAYGNNSPVDSFGGEAGLDVALGRNLSAYASWALVLPQGQIEAGHYGVPPHFSPRHKVGGGLRIHLPAGAYLTADAQYFGRATVARPDLLHCPTELYCRDELGDLVMVHARAGWEFPGGLDLSIAVTNALDDRTPQLPGAQAPERRVAAALAWYHR